MWVEFFEADNRKVNMCGFRSSRQDEASNPAAVRFSPGCLKQCENQCSSARLTERDCHCQQFWKQQTKRCQQPRRPL
ncbi:hypothetical protein WJX77_005048 [Trebouxia sp. C0004]